MDEFELINKFFRQPHEADLARYPQVALGIGDDCAILNPTGQQIVISTDAMVSGRHFLEASPGSWVADRALGAAVSDLAAMGASPLGFTLSLSIPQLDIDWCESFADALRKAAATWQIPLLGGDTVKGPLTVSVTVLGQVPIGSALCRSGAKVGDDIWVSGWLGGAVAGLGLARQGNCPKQWELLLEDYICPQPRLKLGVSLLGRASAAIDISDGLLADLQHLLDASNVGAEIFESSLPLRQELVDLKGREVAVQYALSGGDDYELCFTASPEIRETIALCSSESLPLTRVGAIQAAIDLVLLKPTGERILQQSKGFNHFSKEVADE